MSERHPVVVRYLEALERSLAEMPAAARADVGREIASHLEQGLAAGRPLDELIAALGPADALGRAYAVEFLLRRPGPGLGALDRVFRAIGILAGLTLPSLVLVPLLGGLLVGLGVGGGALVVGAFVPGVLSGDGIAGPLAPWQQAGLGLVLLAAGAGCGALLFLYVRFLLAVLRNAAGREPLRFALRRRG